MKNDTINILDSFFQETPILRGQPTEIYDIERAELELNVKFDSDYKEFISFYGGSIVGNLPIYGFKNSEVMEDRSVTDVTLSFREDEWPGIKDSYVFSVDQAGNPIFSNYNKQVAYFDHDAGQEYVLAESFENWLTKLLKS